MGVGIFHAADFAVFAAVLLVSIGVGIFYSVTPGRRARTPGEFLLGGRHMSFLPTVVSMVVTFTSPVIMLGFASETYFYGLQFSFYPVGMALGAVFSAILFVPLLYPLKLTSSNQYLKLRYNSKLVTFTGTLTQLLIQLLGGGLVMLGPSLLLETMADCPVWASMLVLGAVATLYTTLGGLRAVIVADTFQAAVMVAGQLAIVIQGFLKVGTPSAVVQNYADENRLSLDLVPSPLKRWDVWSLTLLNGLMFMILYGPIQPSYQRIASLPSKNRAMGSVLAMIPLILLFGGLACLGGMTTYAYYASIGCDPYRAGYINDENQVIPYFVMDMLNIPSVPGLFVAAIFCGSLSNLSSWLSSMAALVWDDLLKNKFKYTSEYRQMVINKLLVVLFGTFMVAFSFGVLHVGGTLIQITVSIMSILIIPFGLLFLLGAMSTRVNWMNVFISFSISFASLLFLSVTSVLYKVNQTVLPTPTANCSRDQRANHGSTPNVLDFTHGKATQNLSVFEMIYSISPTWYPVVGLTIGFVCAILLSCIPALREDAEIDDRLLFPCLRRLQRRRSHRYHVTRADDTLSDNEIEMTNQREANAIMKRRNEQNAHLKNPEKYDVNTNNLSHNSEESERLNHGNERQRNSKQPLIEPRKEAPVWHHSSGTYRRGNGHDVYLHDDIHDNTSPRDHV